MLHCFFLFVRFVLAADDRVANLVTGDAAGTVGAGESRRGATRRRRRRSLNEKKCRELFASR
jgi:hypothetical protein